MSILCIPMHGELNYFLGALPAGTNENFFKKNVRQKFGLSVDQLQFQFRKVSPAPKPKEAYVVFMGHLSKLLDSWVEVPQAFTHAQMRSILIK